MGVDVARDVALTRDRRERAGRRRIRPHLNERLHTLQYKKGKTTPPTGTPFHKTRMYSQLWYRIEPHISADLREDATNSFEDPQQCPHPLHLVLANTIIVNKSKRS